MSCGQIALQRAGIPVEKYYASEIDKYAIQVTMKNYPDTVQLGSITEWENWNIEQPDIIIGGSPCQGFSFAGKQLNFEDERSKLFFTFVDILKYYKPKYFLLENVVMKKEYNDVISSILGDIYPECVSQGELFRTGRLEPIQINSALVSAQNRNRLYWTNIPGVTQPKDKGILLKDIIENAMTDRDKSYCLDANYFKGSSVENYQDKSRRQLVITGGAFRGRNGKPIIIPENTETPFMLTETRSEHGKETRRKIKQETGKDSTKRDIDSKIYKPNNNGKANCLLTSNADDLSTVFVKTEQRLEINETGKSDALTSVSKDSLCIEVGQADISGNESNKRVYSIEGKSSCMNTCGGGNREPKISIDHVSWRKLTPIECERLQTVPDNYTNHVSNSQRYKMLGNGWTIDVISHILDFIK